MKKFMAGVLAAASALSITATASAAATDKTVTKPGELSYDVAVTAPKVVLNLVMPAKMTASLNPYGADIKVDATDTSKTIKTLIASPAFMVKNLTTDYGVYLDAKAVTTITTTDKPNADKTPAWGVVSTAITAKQGVKNANMSLMSFKDVDTMVATDKAAAANKEAANDGTQGGVLVLDSTKDANKDAGTVAGETSQSKIMYLKAAADKDTPETGYLGFIGTLGTTKPAAGQTAEQTVTWNEDDAINVNLVLKVVAGPKDASAT